MKLSETPLTLYAPVSGVSVTVIRNGRAHVYTATEASLKRLQSLITAHRKFPAKRPGVSVSACYTQWFGSSNIRKGEASQ